MPGKLTGGDAVGWREEYEVRHSAADDGPHNDGYDDKPAEDSHRPAPIRRCACHALTDFNACSASHSIVHPHIFCVIISASAGRRTPAGPRSERSAQRLRLVASGLISTINAPHRRAVSGRLAAG